MSADAIFVVVYGVVVGVWVLTALARSGWDASKVPTIIGRDVGTAIAGLAGIARGMAALIDAVAAGVREGQSSAPRGADDRLDAARGAFLRGDIDLDEYERSAERLLRLETR